MKKSSNAFDVLYVFAQYGFRKASMTDIAEAAGLSRQSIYNQYGSKEAVLDWAVDSVLTTVTNAAVEVFAQGGEVPEVVLAQAFQAWIGDHVAIWRGTPHGAEIMEFAIASSARAEADYEGTFSIAMSAYILNSGLAASAEAAEDMGFVINTVSKGLLLKSTNSEDYAAGMKRALRVLCGGAS